MAALPGKSEQAATRIRVAASSFLWLIRLTDDAPGGVRVRARQAAGDSAASVASRSAASTSSITNPPAWR